MKLAISNIAWESQELDEHLKLIKQLGCQGVEIAPSLIWPEPTETSSFQRKDLKRKINNFDLNLVGLHALLFTRPDLELFLSRENRTQTGEYLIRLFELCRDLGGKTLIFGSPKNRRLHDQHYQDCFKIAVDFFQNLAESARNCDVIFCIEPLSHKETEFITSSPEAFELVDQVNHPSFGLHLDTKAMIDSKEDFHQVFKRYAKMLRHFHVSEEGLKPPGTMGFDHKQMGSALRQSGYTGYISIEMRRGLGRSQETIEKTIRYVRECYFL